MYVLVKQVPGLAKKDKGWRLVIALKKEHSNTYLQDEINCWVPNRWEAPWTCTLTISV